MKRLIVLPALLLVLILTGAAGAASLAPFPDTISLPDGFFPEGIVVGKGSNFYAGSLVDGRLFHGDVRSGQQLGQSDPVPGQLAVGLAFDERTNLVYSAGGPGAMGGKVAIFDGRSLDLVHNITLSPAAGFVNDVIITREAAYLTDSFAPVLYRLGLDPNGLPDPGDVSTLFLDGFGTTQGFNANGIVATSDDRWLLVVNSSSGLLYRVDPATGVSEVVDLGSENALSGDGMVLDGTTLYVVQNAFQQVAVFQMRDDFSTGHLLKIIDLPESETPTTADLFGSGLYIVDARFGTPPLPSVSYEVTRVDK